MRRKGKGKERISNSQQRLDLECPQQAGKLFDSNKLLYGLSVVGPFWILDLDTRFFDVTFDHWFVTIHGKLHFRPEIVISDSRQGEDAAIASGTSKEFEAETKPPLISYFCWAASLFMLDQKLAALSHRRCSDTFGTLRLVLSFPCLALLLVLGVALLVL